MDIPTFHPDEYNCAKEYDYEGDRIATWAYPTVMETTFRPSTPTTEAVEEVSDESAETAHEESVAESCYCIFEPEPKVSLRVFYATLMMKNPEQHEELQALYIFELRLAREGREALKALIKARKALKPLDFSPDW